MEYKVENQVLTLYFVGELNSSNSEDVESEIDKIIKQNSFKSIVLDLEKLNYISSAGLRIVVRLKQQYDDTKIINAQSGVYDIFAMVGFNSIISIKKI